MVAGEGGIDLVIDGQQLLYQTLLLESGDQLHHPVLHRLTDCVQLLLREREGRRAGEREIKSWT